MDRSAHPETAPAEPTVRDAVLAPEAAQSEEIELLAALMIVANEGDRAVATADVDRALQVDPNSSSRAVA